MALTPELRKHFGAPEDRGLLVGHVEPGSPAASAGIVVGDVLVEVRGHGVARAAEVLDALAGVGKGQDATLQVIRDRQPMTLHATLGDDTDTWSDGWWRDLMREMWRPHWLPDLVQPWRGDIAT